MVSVEFEMRCTLGHTIVKATVAHRASEVLKSLARTHRSSFFGYDPRNILPVLYQKALIQAKVSHLKQGNHILRILSPKGAKLASFRDESIKSSSNLI